MNKIYLKCDCSSETLELEHDAEYQELNIVIWRLSINSTLCLRERLRWCWKILITGNPWSDSVILSKEKVKELKEFVDKIEKKD